MKVLVKSASKEQVRPLNIHAIYGKAILDKIVKRSEFTPIAPAQEIKYSVNLDFYKFWESVCEAFNEVFKVADELAETYEVDIIDHIINTHIEHDDISKAPQLIYNHLMGYFNDSLQLDSLRIKKQIDSDSNADDKQTNILRVALTYNNVYLPVNYKETKISKGKIEIYVDLHQNADTQQWELEDYHDPDYQFEHSRKELFEKMGWQEKEKKYLTMLLDNTQTTNKKDLNWIINDYIQQQTLLTSEEIDDFQKLELIGSTIWGYSWQKEMAIALGYKGAGNIRAWRTNKNVPDSVFPKLKEALYEHAKKASELADLL